MFLGQVEVRQKALRQRIREIRGVLTDVLVLGPKDPGVTNGLRIPYEIRDRIVEIQSRHGMRSSKEAIYKSMLLGLLTLERLEPAKGAHLRSVDGRSVAAREYRVLTDQEVTQLKDEGFGAVRS